MIKLFLSNLQSKLRFFRCKFFTDPNNKERVISRDTQTWNDETYYELERNDANLRVKHSKMSLNSIRITIKIRPKRNEDSTF